MITITKEGNEDYPDIRISDKDKSFRIIRNNAPDPFWIPDYHPFDDKEDIEFTIDSSDGDVYIIFEKLYDDIISGNVFSWSNKSDKEKAKNQKRLQTISQNTGLVEDGVIRWHSDDYHPYESAAVLAIKKEDNQIKIIFSKSKNDPFIFIKPTYAIRISENGSLYQEFYAPFVTLHRNLQILDLSNIHNDNDVRTKELALKR